MTPEAIVYEGCLRVCDQSTNLIIGPAIEKKNENGKVVQKSFGLMFLRGEQVSFIAPNLNAQLHRFNEPIL